MQLEKLRKSHKRKIIIGGFIIVCVISAITITITRAKYKITEDLELAKGTVNYKPYDFKIMAMYKSEDKTNYTEINEMPTSGYIINEEKSYCNMSDGNKDTTAILKTIDGNHTIGKLKKNDRCYLYFDKYIPPITIPDIVASVNPKDTIPDFSKVATTDEGVYKVSDGMYGGTSYYWRGAVTNNYVKFGGFCWRAIRINGDGSMRLIYDGKTCHANGISTTDSIAVASVAYNSSYNQTNYVGWTYEGVLQRPTKNGTATNSNAKTQTEIWYNNNLASYAERIADGKFCNDREVSNGTWTNIPTYGTSFNYAAYTRLIINKTPTLSCNNIGDVYTLKAGAITADESVYAGNLYSTAVSEGNKSYYLYNGQKYWTMTPFYVYSDGCNAFVFDGISSFSLKDYQGVTSSRGIRPVINLKSDITISSGNGTIDTPYIVD